MVKEGIEASPDIKLTQIKVKNIKKGTEGIITNYNTEGDE